MRKVSTAILCIATAMPSTAQVMSPATAVSATPSPLTFTIPADTEIWLSPLRDISSKHVHQGDAITMQVSRDVYVHRVLAIPRGAEATGKISYRTGKGALGKSAKIEFDLASILIAHRPLPIAAHYRVAGDGNSAWAVATFLLVSMVGSLFITGHSAVVPAGSEWRATTTAPLDIALDDEALSPVTLASFRQVRMQTAGELVGGSERLISLNSAYTPPPTEIFVRSLPARP